MIFFEIIHIGYKLSFVFALLLGGIIYFKNKKKTVNQIFFLEAISASVWIFTVLMADTSKTYQSALLWTKMAMIGSAFVPYFFLLFSFVFPSGRLPPLKKTILLSLFPTLFTFLSPTSLNVRDIKVEPWGTSVEAGILYYLLFLYFLIYIGGGFYVLIKKYKKLGSLQKLQVIYILVGYSLTFLFAVTTNLILVIIGHSEYSIFGPPSTLVFIVFAAYAIIKYRLFEIKVVLTQILVVIIAFLLLVDVFTSEMFLERIWKGVLFITFLAFGYLLIKSVLQEIKRREEIEEMSYKLQKTYQELKKLDIAKTEFISIASHQLRTPLTVIKGFISMLLEGTYGKLPQKTRGPMENVFKSNERLIKLVNNMLTISKVEMGKLEPEFEKADINEIISELVQEFKMQADEKGLYLKWQKPKKKLPKILIDKDKIRQALSNLLDNAIHYTEKGEIIIKVQGLGSKVQVMISDTGAGMGKEEASKMFQSFARGTAGSRLWVEGAGLGLYIAKKYIDLHKGKIWVESEGKGKGSTFFIELPIK